MKNDEELMKLLESSPEEGMERLIDRCSGLVWSVVRRHLEDEEDARECVNDTFLEFYRHRGRLDLTKGSVELYIGILAKSLAINRYRYNSRQVESADLADIPDPSDLIDTAPERIDVENAIAELSPEDAKLIRMHYYGNMTIHEIAESMGIPYETAKKRHQRSLRRLRAILTAGLAVLLALALAACTYFLLRRFGIVPGIGTVDVDVECYLLEDPAAADIDGLEVHIDRAVWLDGTLTVTGYCHPGEALAAELEGEAQPLDTVSGLLGPMVLSDGEWRDFSSFSCGILPDGSFLIDLASPIPELDMDGVRLRLGGGELELELARAQNESIDSSSLALTEYGGLMARTRREEDGLYVDVYTLNTTGYTISPLLIYDFYHQGKTGDITLISESGEEYTGEWTYNPNSSLNGTISSWSFGGVPEGEYELRLPYIYLGIPEPEGWEDVGIDLDLHALTWSGEAIKTPVGTLTVEGCETGPASDAAERLHATDAVPIFPEDAQGWYVTLGWEPGAEGLTLATLPVSVTALPPEGHELSLSVTQYQGIPEDRLLIFILDEPYFENAVSSSSLHVEFPIGMRYSEQIDIPVTVMP